MGWEFSRQQAVSLKNVTFTITMIDYFLSKFGDSLQKRLRKSFFKSTNY